MAQIRKTVYEDQGIIMNITNEPDTVKVIKGRRLRWLGKLLQNTGAKTVHKPEGTRRVGRPAIRWLHSVDEDLKTTGARNWSSQDMTGYRKRGQGPSWTVGPAEEEAVILGWSELSHIPRVMITGL
jgi:hypothetical protein